MLRTGKYNWLVFFFCLCCLRLPAQMTNRVPSPIPEASGYYTIGNIIIAGNKKTKNEIIERELTFKREEQMSAEELVNKMETGRQQLMNTTLFNHVMIAVKDYDGSRVNILVEVKERWYLFPVPYFKPVDRNLNQWLVEQEGSLDRVNYGAKLSYNNVTGRNDKFRLWLINGYSKQISFSYQRSYIDKNLKWGLATSFAMGKNREINYNTVNDKQVFLKDPDRYVRRLMNGHIAVSFRPAIRAKHSFGIGFSSEEVNDTIVALNPSYFKPGRNRIGYPSLFYNLSYFNVDYIPYPTKGYAAQVSLSKNGLNQTINLWQLHIKGLANWPLAPKTFLHLNGYAGIKLPFKQPWFNKRFFGYGDINMQGYEYFVTDGVAGGFLKTTLSRELLNFKLRLPKGKGREAERIPFRVFGKIYGNTGYVHNPQPGENDLSNKMLYSGGVGIDIVTLYDVAIRLEWSFNQLGQNGLFLHRKTIF
ncbi:MAG: POTRA domain-containing protein [Bacteroidota bacterium]